MNFLFLSKCHRKEPLQFPNRDLYVDSSPLLGVFYISHKFLIKFTLNKVNFPFKKCLGKGASLHVTQKRDSYGNRRPFQEPYLAYYSWSPVK